MREASLRSKSPHSAAKTTYHPSNHQQNMIKYVPCAAGSAVPALWNQRRPRFAAARPVRPPGSAESEPFLSLQKELQKPQQLVPPRVERSKTAETLTACRESHSFSLFLLFFSSTSRSSAAAIAQMAPRCAPRRGRRADRGSPRCCLDHAMRQVAMKAHASSHLGMT